MRPDVGSTTVTEAGSSRPAGGARDTALVWLFPRPGEPAVSLNLDPETEVVIGRDASCAVRLEGNDVSRRHAAIKRGARDSEVVITDLQSRNGIRINGRQVQSGPLSLGDVVRVGGWIGVVTETPGPFGELAPGFFGGPALQAAIAPLVRAAPSDLPIVLEGETGTGKEVVARGIHQRSGRAGPFVAVNCGALPEALAEGELFGYRRGAFTGADRASPGLFRSAEGGTLLLDADLPPALQAKLLRVLEEREVQPLGETRPVPVDVRILVAGQQSLADVVREGRFRPDLLARVDGVTIRLPPLRRRREDVPPLFSHLLGRFAQAAVPAIETDLVERLCLHDWPFNVRELVLLARRLLTLHGHESTLTAHHLPERIGASGTGAGAASRAAGEPPAAKPAPPAPSPGAAEPVELPALMVALRAAGGNVARASAMLGITRQRAYRLMDAESVDLEALRGEQEPHR
jgi:transcriptional regulator of acetoin/glycerol metabolism